MILPALSVRQPWAALLTQRAAAPAAIAAKDIETRTWCTRYRGPLVICSSGQPRDQGPAGQALGVRMLKACRPMTAADELAARCAVYEHAQAWVLGRLWPLVPFAVRGQRGLFGLLVPEHCFPDPAERAEVQQALDWARGHGLLRWVHGF
jgi:hypothetical protein